MNRWMPAAAIAALMLGLVGAPLVAEPLTDAERQRLLERHTLQIEEVKAAAGYPGG